MHQSTFYILDADNNPVPSSFLDCCALLEDIQRRRLALTVLRGQDGTEVKVSTIFLCLDMGDNPPRLFETMVSGPAEGRRQWRYLTWGEAMDGHNRVVREIEEHLAQDAPKRA